MLMPLESGAFVMYISLIAGSDEYSDAKKAEKKAATYQPPAVRASLAFRQLS